MKKIKLTESDLYRIVRKVLLEQEEEQNNRRIFNKNQEYFKMLLENVFRNDSEKLTRVFNKQYDKVIIKGNLNLFRRLIQSLPDNLYVKGGLYLGETPIESLPDNLYVGGSLDLEETPVQSLPDNLYVGGDLDLRGCENIKSLPDNLHVEGDLDLSETPIESLPDNLKVGGLLYLEDTKINSIPDNLVEKISWYDMKRLIKKNVIDEPNIDYDIELFIPIKELEYYIDNRQDKNPTEVYESILLGTLSYNFMDWSDGVDFALNYVNNENENKIDDILNAVAIKRNFDMDEFDYMDLEGKIEEFDEDGEIKQAISDSVNFAEEHSFIKMHKETLSDCLYELGTVEEINSDGIKLRINMEKYLWPERYPREKFSFTSLDISKDMNECEFDLTCVFKTLIGIYGYDGYSRIDRPTFYIDDKRSPYVEENIFNQHLKEILEKIS